MNNELNNNGFLIIRKCIPLDVISECQACVSEYLGCINNQNSIISSIELIEEKNPEKFLDFCTNITESIPFLQIKTNERIIKILKNYLNETVYTIGSGVFYNKKDVKRLQYDWHIERSYYPHAEEVLTLWFPWLHPIDENNGPMIIAKSSNKKKLGCEQEVVKNGLTQMRINESDLDEFEKISCDLDLGDIVLFTFDTAHKTGINHSDKPRINSICRYSNAKTKFGENPFNKNRDK